MKQQVDPAIFRLIQLTSHLQKVGTPQPNLQELKNYLKELSENPVDFPRLSTSASILRDLLKPDSSNIGEVLDKSRNLVDKLKEDLNLPPLKKKPEN